MAGSAAPRRRAAGDRRPRPHGRRRPTFLPVASSPLVALRFVFRVGSQDDPKGKEGLAALTAAMVAEGGTKDLTYDQLLEQFYPMAAGSRRRLPQEVTVFAGEVHRDNLAAYVPLVTSMLTTPRFAPEDFERLQNEALDYLTKTLRGGNDEELGKWTLQLALYQDHPYGHVDQGTVAGLKAITLDDVKAFHKQHYTREALDARASPAASIRRSSDELEQRPRLARRRGRPPRRSCPSPRRRRGSR